MKRTEVLLVLAGLALMALGITTHARALGRRDVALPSDRFAVSDVRLFDGEEVVERATVVVEGGRISAVGSTVTVPSGVPTIDGHGKTLLPALIDAHTHVFWDALERALRFGVATEIDMFSDHRFAAAQRAEQTRGPVSHRADLVSAGTLVTAPGGHGTEYGVPIPTLGREEEARRFVEARVAEGSDFIKIVYDDLATMGDHWPTLDRNTMRAVILAAHAQHKLAVVHVSTRAAAFEALEAGADGLAHVWRDLEADEAIIALAQRRGAFVIPTLVVVSSIAGGERLNDATLDAWLRPSERDALLARFPHRVAAPVKLEVALSSVRRLHQAGVPILAGTDAPNPGTTHGASLHHELELLVRAGLSPLEALRAASLEPARRFGLGDRGRVAPGLRADLLLVEGDPTMDIKATRHIAAVWKGGRLVSRERGEPSATPRRIEGDGRVSDFEVSLESAFGAGWSASTDEMLGGTSTCALARVAGALEVRGELGVRASFPWAGAMFFPGPTPMAPADVSRFRSIVFRARGDGGRYRVLLFATHLGNMPVEQPFTAGAEWTEVSLPFSAFADIDGSDLRGVLFSASDGPRHFEFELDDVRFR